MIFPISRDDSCSESTGGVHAWSGVRNNAKMTQCDSQSNGQWGDEAGIWFVLIGDAENDQNQNESEEELKAKSLKNTNMCS